MTVPGETYYNIAQAVAAVTPLAPFGAAVSAVFQLVTAATKKENPTIEEALDEFEKEIKDWVNQRIDQELQEFEVEQLRKTYRGLVTAFANWEHDRKALGEDLQPEQIARLRRRLVDLAIDFTTAMPSLTETKAYQLEVLPIFGLWVTFHMSMLRQLELEELKHPDQPDTFDQQYRIDYCLVEYLQAAYAISAEILRKVYDPGRIETKDRIHRRSVSDHEVECKGIFSWEDKRTGKTGSITGTWTETTPGPVSEADRFLMQREHQIRDFLKSEVETWHKHLGLIKSLNVYKKWASEKIDWSLVERLEKLTTLSGKLAITRKYGGDSGDTDFYLFPKYVNTRLVRLNCWVSQYRGNTYVGGLELEWEDGPPAFVHAQKEKKGDPHPINLEDVQAITEISLHWGDVVDSIKFQIKNKDGSTEYSEKVGGDRGTKKEDDVFKANWLTNARLIGVTGKMGWAIDSMQFIVEDQSPA